MGDSSADESGETHAAGAGGGGSFKAAGRRRRVCGGSSRLEGSNVRHLVELLGEVLAGDGPGAREEGALVGGFTAPWSSVFAQAEQVQALLGARGGDVEQARGLGVLGFAVEVVRGIRRRAPRRRRSP